MTANIFGWQPVCLHKTNNRLIIFRFRGSAPIVKDKNNLEEIYEFFMHESKAIRPLAFEYMQLTMKPDAMLKFILKRFEKYDVPITETVESIFDRQIFAQWEVYGVYLENALNNVRSVSVTTEVIKQVFVQLTDEYRGDEKQNSTTTEIHDAKIDILDFIKLYPKFLYVYRVTSPHIGRYVKMLGLINAIDFEDISRDVSDHVVNKLKEELLAGLESFETFSAIDGIMQTLLKLRQYFKVIEEETMDRLVYHSSKFAVGKLATPQDLINFKRATYVVYTTISKKKTDLIPSEHFETLYLESLQPMLDDDFLEKAPAKGAVLAVWAQVLAKCFKIVADRIKETKKDEGEINLASLETSMKDVLKKMRVMMTKTVESKTVVLFSDMRLILVNAGNLLHYLWILKKKTEPENSILTFTCVVKLTEMMLIHTDFPDIIYVFVDFYDVHYDIIENHEEISHILQHFGQPIVHKHSQFMTEILTISHSRDNTEDKSIFRKTIGQTLISIKNNSASNAESNISLFWLSFREFNTSKLKLKTKDFLSFIANLSFEILQHQLNIPQTNNNLVNRFQIFQMIPLIVDDMRKSSAVTTSVKEVFSAVQQKHETDFSSDENQSIKEFLRGFSNKKRRHASQLQETNED